jgi:hypothetical protein
MDTATALIISFVFAGVMVYIVDKKWGGPDDSYEG